MKFWKLIPILLLGTLTSCLTQGEIEDADVYKTPYKERMKMAEEKFFAAQKEGKPLRECLLKETPFLMEPQNLRTGRMESLIPRKNTTLPQSAQSATAKYSSSQKTGHFTTPLPKKDRASRKASRLIALPEY